MNIEDAFEWFDNKDDIFNHAKYNDNWDSCIEDVDRMIYNKILFNKKTRDHTLDDSIRDYPDLVAELKHLWNKEWKETA